jgi:3-phenylpropionate/trans-cinnamate dioxygenase ferredoxin reductase subunit
MPHYPYVIVGAGMAGHAAVKGIREVDPEAIIALVGLDPNPPYKRPPLTKDLWKGKPLESIWYPSDMPGVDLFLGRRVKNLAPRRKEIIDDRGEVFSYDKLLLATGGTPRPLGLGAADEYCVTYRTVDDYRRLRSLADTNSRFAVVGAGFIGSELAAALAMNGKQVTMMFPGDAIGQAVFPREEALFLNSYYEQRGVHLRPNYKVHGVERRGQDLVVTARNSATGQTITEVVDAVVVGVGITLNLQLAQEAGLKIEDGIVVDETLRTSEPDIYAAGDTAAFYNPVLDKRMRVEHEDNARKMGRQAGAAMAHHRAGQEAPPYHYLPFFYSDLFDLGYEAVGDVSAKLETVVYWQQPHEKGMIFYLHGGRVRGVLMWNVWDNVAAARKLIAQPGPLEPADLKLYLPWAAAQADQAVPKGNQ